MSTQLLFVWLKKSSPPVLLLKIESPIDYEPYMRRMFNEDSADVQRIWQ